MQLRERLLQMRKQGASVVAKTLILLMASAMYRISDTWHKTELLFDENVPSLYKKHHSSSTVHALCCGEAEEILEQ